MMPNKADKYLESQVMTASKEQLLLMLFDGAIRFSEQAKQSIDKNDSEISCKMLLKSQRIMVELTTTLQKDLIGEELYNNLTALYNFVYFRLVRANMTKDKKLVDEALKILNILRDAWKDAIEKDKQTKLPLTATLGKANQEMQKANTSNRLTA